MAVSDEAAAVLDFWLRETPPEQRWIRDDALDADIAGRFGALHARLVLDVAPAWRDDPRALLAAVIVLDQFSRNLYRNDPAAFAQDAAARVLVDIALARGDDAAMTDDERSFLYMPLMHSEDAADQARSVACFAELDGNGHDYALAHQRVIARFGRFPHRNAALGRTSTPAEVDFIASKKPF